jgi:homoserine kinase
MAASAAWAVHEEIVTVQVPASTSNLGSGFDCVGMAVNRWLTIRARRAYVSADGQPALGRSPTDRRSGTLEGMALAPGDDLVRVGFAAACEAGGLPRGAAQAAVAELSIEATSQIPVARGLGSSAAAVVAGAALAERMLGLGLDQDRLLEVCTGVEGHPDNVAPALRGGAVLALRDGGEKLHLTALEVHPSIAFAFAIPDFTVETRAARAVLPQSVPHHIAVTAAARTAALVRGLASGDGALLKIGLDDVLHVPHRRHLVPGFDAVEQAAIEAGAFGATLSGSGPSIVAIVPRPAATRVADAMRNAWWAQGISAESFCVAGPVPGYRMLEPGHDAESGSAQPEPQAVTETL